MASVLKFYKNGGETLATFNNSRHISKKLLNQIILRANFKKAKKYLKWQPKISFKSLVKEMVDYDLKKTKK